MNSTESYPGYRNKEDFKSSEIYPSIFRLLIMYIGAMDTIFGVLILIVSLQKSIFNIAVFVLLVLSLFGGISCVIVAKKPTINKINNLLKFGLVVGLFMGLIYFYAVLQTLSRM